MSSPAPDAERDRLAQHYAAMSDEELIQILESGDELSDAASEALHAEAGKRSLDLAPAARSGEDVVELNRTIILRQFRDLPEALLAKAALESAGIEVYLADDNLVRMDWYYSNLIGGIKVKVHPEDADAANEILNQPIPEVLDVEGVGSFEQPRCPQCQSLDIAQDEVNKGVGLTAAWAVSIPIPLYHKGWRCHACGHEWNDDSPLPE